MSRLVACMRLNLSQPLSSVLLASDAEGANAHDWGGFGVVAAECPMVVIEECLRAGCAPRLTVCSLDGDLRQLRRPERELQSCTPLFALRRPVLAGPTLGPGELRSPALGGTHYAGRGSVISRRVLRSCCSPTCAPPHGPESAGQLAMVGSGSQGTLTRSFTQFLLQETLFVKPRIQYLNATPLGAVR